MLDTNPVWTPSPERMQCSRMYEFARAAAAQSGRSLPDQSSLWRWSVECPEDFWNLIWSFFGIVGERGERTLVDGQRMPGARWFPDARLNLAENLLRDHGDPEHEAVVFRGEDRIHRSLTHRELRRQVARMAASMRAAGIGSQDVVAAYMPNVPETLVAMLAAVSLGAIFTSTSPDFGVQGVLDRFAQSKPKLLFAVDGYWYNRKHIGCLDRLEQIASQLPSVERVVVVPYAGDEDRPLPANACWLQDFLAAHDESAPLSFAQLPFDHPVFILYSSGTTGAPKGIVHGAGGVLLQNLKDQQLHGDVRRNDRYFYFTTCGWTMWNILATVLASGATIVLYDGAPLLDDGRLLFRMAAEERLTHFGTSAKFIDSIAKAGLKPRESFDLSALRVIFSTGSPLAPEAFDYVYAHVKSDVQLSSISGGTDICSGFVLGTPLLPVHRGEIQCRGLGMAVAVFDENGRPVVGTKGELVCTAPFPAMPVGFWNDPDGKRYRAAYFERFANVWCHGDFTEITANDGVVIYGRSDAVLNPGGVRIGTAEIYRQVEKVEEVVESLAVGQEWSGDVRVVLFVRLREGVTLDDGLRLRIRETIRRHATPRHVPAKIVQIQDLPRTKNGKLVELPVREVIHGRSVRNVDALANPEALELFRELEELQQD